jgi:putative aminopeptidase FrvX
MELLKELCAIQGVSGDEIRVKNFILDYVNRNKNSWKHPVKIIEGDHIQDCIILVFGKPRCAVFAHMDNVGFTVGYHKELIKVGGPKCAEGTKLIGEDSNGTVECEYLEFEQENGRIRREYVCGREIDRGTNLSYQRDWREDENYVQSCYMDDRLGIWNALKLCEDLENGAIAFSCFEEHGGGTVGFLANLLWHEYGVRQALISDITWVTEGVKHGEGVAISMRDSGIPRRSYLNKILDIANSNSINYQLEVESAGGSDGNALQRSPYPFDWLFIGAPESNVHSPDEIVHKTDIAAMLELYQVLMREL